MTSAVDIARPGGPPDRLVVPARLELTRTRARVTITAAEDADGLCRASFVGPAPRLRDERRTIIIEYPWLTPGAWLRVPRRAADITIAAETPWEIVSAGGIAQLRVDLSRGELRSLEINGGVSDGRLHLSEPRGVVPLRIGGGVRQLDIRRPAGTAVRLHVSGGAHRLAFDDARYGAIGGTIALATPGAADTTDRYEIQIAGGASTLTIGSRDPDVAA
jgi:hypothetical protein